MKRIALDIGQMSEHCFVDVDASEVSVNGDEFVGSVAHNGQIDDGRQAQGRNIHLNKCKTN